jgi:hypothetical protein
MERFPDDRVELLMESRGINPLLPLSLLLIPPLDVLQHHATVSFGCDYRRRWQ